MTIMWIEYLDQVSVGPSQQPPSFEPLGLVIETIATLQLIVDSNCKLSGPSWKTVSVLIWVKHPWEITWPTVLSFVIKSVWNNNHLVPQPKLVLKILLHCFEEDPWPTVYVVILRRVWKCDQLVLQPKTAAKVPHHSSHTHLTNKLSIGVSICICGTTKLCDFWKGVFFFLAACLRLVWNSLRSLIHYLSTWLMTME